jgi:superfamily II DNA/RNA helicase
VEKGLKPILKRARQESANDDEFRLKRKVIIFTYCADTVDWIIEYLQEQFDKDPALKPYRGRLVSVAGEETDLGIPRKEAVFGFAPVSSEAPAGLDQDQFDVMVTTNVLAEGMNLQDCRNIINYDLPWNPM